MSSRKRKGIQLWGLGFDSKSLLFPRFSPLFFTFFPPTPSNKTNGLPAGIACVYLCGIDLTSKPPREEKEKRFVFYFIDRGKKKEREKTHTHTEKERERKSRNGGKCNESKQNYSLLPAGWGWWYIVVMVMVGKT
jgi:hypothetical protein